MNLVKSKINVFLGLFLCGATTMLVELTASRLLAPFYGGTIVIWTNIMGIILGSLSIGYLIGGWFSKKDNFEIFFVPILLLAALYLIFVGTWAFSVLKVLQHMVPQLAFGSFVASLILFTFPSICLASIVPLGVRALSEEENVPGKVAGIAYAFSTIGSIAGVFATGLILIPQFGSRTIFFIAAGMLVLASLLLSIKAYKRNRFIIPLILIPFFLCANKHRQTLLKDNVIDTQHTTYFLREYSEKETGRRVRALSSSPFGMQSGIYLDTLDKPAHSSDSSIEDLPADYTRFFDLLMAYNPDAKSAAVVGAGAFTWPRSIVRKMNNLHLDVVDFDPGVERIGKKWFDYEGHPRISFFAEDGRIFFESNRKRYDAIIIDAFNGPEVIPFQLFSFEAFSLLKERLNPGGVLFVNVISAIQGEGGKIYRAVRKTVKSVFPTVHEFVTRNVNGGTSIQNVVFVCGLDENTTLPESNDERLQKLLAKQYKGEVEDHPFILTDMYSPVDLYSDTMFRSSF